MRHIINSFLFFIIFLFTASSVSAIALNIDSPDEVNFDEEFTVKIDSDSTQTYDVKIFVYSSTDEKVTRGDIVSLLYWEDSWKDPWTYISSSFPLVKEYNIKVSEEATEYILCAQFRIPGKTTIEAKSCKDITVASNDPVASKQTEKKEKEVEEDTQEEKEDTQDEKPSPPRSQQSISTSAVNEEPDVKPEKIVLKSTSSPPQSPSISFVTKEQKTRVYLLYGFAFFCLVLIIFLAIRKI